MFSLINLADCLYGIYSIEDLLLLESKFSSYFGEPQVELLNKVLSASPLRTSCDGYYSRFNLNEFQIREISARRGNKIVLPDEEVRNTYASISTSKFYDDLFNVLIKLLKSQVLTEVFIENMHFKLQTERAAAVVILDNLDDLAIDYTGLLHELEEAARLYVDHLPLWKDYGQLALD